MLKITEEYAVLVFCRIYTYLDTYIATNMILCIAVVARSLSKALADPSILKYSWHLHVQIVLSMVSCVANLTVIFRCAADSPGHRMQMGWPCQTGSTAAGHVSNQQFMADRYM